MFFSQFLTGSHALPVNTLKCVGINLNFSFQNSKKNETQNLSLQSFYKGTIYTECMLYEYIQKNLN